MSSAPLALVPIPRILHLIWVGDTAPPPLVARCIDTWRSQLPNFTITRWDEKNIPLDHPYVRRMYAARRWAFVSDYVRFWALERYGGVYLDTDMEVIRSFEPLLDGGPFLGESSDGGVAAGILAFPPHHPLMRDVVALYDDPSMAVGEVTSPSILRSLITGGSYEVTIYPAEIFYPCDEGQKITTDQRRIAFTNHLWAESWVSHAWARKLLRRLGIARALKKLMVRAITVRDSAHLPLSNDTTDSRK